MTDLVAKLWDSLSSSWKRRLFPPAVALLLLAGVLYFLMFVRTNVVAVEVLRSPAFLVVASIVVFFLFAFYIYGLIRQRRSLVVHIYPFGSQNYNIKLLSYLLSSFPGDHFRFVIKRSAKLPKLEHSAKNYDVVRERLEEVHASGGTGSDHEVALALVSLRLHGNLFSIAWPKLAVVSSVDWEPTGPFKPFSVYEYLIHELGVVSLVAASLGRGSEVRYHEPSETVGCIFDYKEDKLYIREALARPSICIEHKEKIRRSFGDWVLADLESLVDRGWLRKDKIKSDLRTLYDFQWDGTDGRLDDVSEPTAQ